MIREDRFLISRRPYAVDLDSFRITDVRDYPTGTWYAARAAAVCFRWRDGLTLACLGELRSSAQAEPKTAEEFLTAYTDGRYGGDCHGRWDGARYWGAQEPAVIEQHLALLRPMLADYPACPDGWDGWWRF